jgi:hypothetical protein
MKLSSYQLVAYPSLRVGQKRTKKRAEEFPCDEGRDAMMS